jgi:hypothetical protein
MSVTQTMSRPHARVVVLLTTRELTLRRSNHGSRSHYATGKSQVHPAVGSLSSIGVEIHGNFFSEFVGSSGCHRHRIPRGSRSLEWDNSRPPPDPLSQHARYCKGARKKRAKRMLTAGISFGRLTSRANTKRSRMTGVLHPPSHNQKSRPLRFLAPSKAG